jgi:hypothetical protein
MSSIITYRLGRLEALSEDVKFQSLPIANNSRWVFDVAQGHTKLELRLLKPHPSSYVPRVKSYALAPLSESFWDARVYLVEDPEDPLRISLMSCVDCTYRIAIDTVV